MRKYILPVLAGALLSTPAMAETTQRDLEVIGRALSFVEGASGSGRTVAIVYDAASEAEAQALAGTMAGGLSAGRVTLNARLVPMADAGSLGGAHAAVLLGGASGDAGVFSAASSAGVMTVSTDMGCVESGNCVMGVQSAPSVRIVVNRGAANASSVSFAAAFAMMIEEI
ncbi:hypothetical protein [Maricaulis sp.]|jgi:lysozyme family protein|uniref:hypothetical protein n=1 Tax=Maricaulis sp. TaxID=1486257 RepID=UPI00261B9956|nr:hypothetical protein [Maricaulis sp.]